MYLAEDFGQSPWLTWPRWDALTGLLPLVVVLVGGMVLVLARCCVGLKWGSPQMLPVLVLALWCGVAGD